MQKTFKNIIMAVSVLGMAGSLAACTSPSTDDGTIEIVWWHTFGKNIQDNIAKQITKFEKLVKENEGVDVKITPVYQGGYNEILEKVTKSFSVSTTPTIAVAYPDHVSDYLYAEGSQHGKYVVNLDDYISNAEYGFGTDAYLGDTKGEDDFISAYLDEGKHYVVNGTYSMPYMKSTEAMFYNYNAIEYVMQHCDNTELNNISKSADAIKSYMSNLSWEKLMELCGYIKELGSSYASTTYEYPMVYDSDANLFISQMYQSGIDYSSIVDGHGQIDFATGENRTKAEAMVSNLKEWFDDGLFNTKGVLGTYGSNDFVGKKTFISIGSTGGSGYQFPDSSAFKVEVAKVPYLNDNPQYISQGVTLTFLKGQQFTAAQNEQKVKYAWKFYKYLTSPKVNVDLCVDGSEGYLPVRKSAYETEKFIEFFEDGESYAQVAKVVTEDIGEDYINTAVFPGSAQLRQDVGALITGVLADGKDVTAAFTEAINDANTYIK